jgi:hypothetical protein
MKRSTVLYAVAFAATLLLSGAATAQNVTVQLLPVDELGDQIEVVQGYYQPLEDPEEMMRLSLGIYDTGASVVTLSALDQYFYPSPVPIKVANGAYAEGVGGDVTGDVSQPGFVVSDGMHSLTFNPSTFDFDFHLNYQAGSPEPRAAVVSGVQMFVGTFEASDGLPGSATLPTISGTPIHRSQNHVGGGAAYIDKQGFSLDLQQLFPDIFAESVPYFLPDLKYVDSGSKLAAPVGTSVTAPIRVPLTLQGENNQNNPGNDITIAPNPFAPNVRLAMGTDAAASSVGGKNFLFDTGAMISLISSETATALGLDAITPTHSMDIAGAAGIGIPVDGYDIPLLEIPYDNLDGTKGMLQIKDAPIFVLDVGTGIDGILGMNLFNTAKEMLYDPNDPNGASLQLTFDTSERVIEELPDLSGSDYYLAYSALFVHEPSIPGFSRVPEPSTFVLLAIGASLLLPWRLLRRQAE